MLLDLRGPYPPQNGARTGARLAKHYTLKHSFLEFRGRYPIGKEELTGVTSTNTASMK